MKSLGTRSRFHIWEQDMYLGRRGCRHMSAVCRTLVSCPAGKIGGKILRFFGSVQTWTLDCGLDHGLDCGLDCGFGSHGWIRAGITPEPYKLWTWHVHHWIQQRLRYKRMCRILWQSHQIWSYGPLKSTTFHRFGWCGWAPEVNHISSIWLVWVNSCWHNYLPNPTSYGHETCIIGYNKD